MEKRECSTALWMGILLPRSCGNMLKVRGSLFLLPWLLRVALGHRSGGQVNSFHVSFNLVGFNCVLVGHGDACKFVLL